MGNAVMVKTRPRERYTWPQPGEWTYEDYLRLPDDGKRYEIIWGVLYVTNAPNSLHQFTVLQIARRLSDFVEKGQRGIVLIAPFEVHLPGIARPVQPDLLFVAGDRLKLGDPYFEGAPDLVVEVLSPGTMRKDRTIKFDAYEAAGVREYWVADPKTRSVEVYSLPEGGREYVLLGQFGSDEKARSEVLEGFQVAVDTLFA